MKFDAAIKKLPITPTRNANRIPFSRILMFECRPMIQKRKTVCAIAVNITSDQAKSKE
jgi:hypothetical protein